MNMGAFNVTTTCTAILIITREQPLRNEFEGRTKQIDGFVADR